MHYNATQVPSLSSYNLKFGMLLVFFALLFVTLSLLLLTYELLICTYLCDLSWEAYCKYTNDISEHGEFPLVSVWVWHGEPGNMHPYNFESIFAKNLSLDMLL